MQGPSQQFHTIMGQQGISQKQPQSPQRSFLQHSTTPRHSQFAQNRNQELPHHMRQVTNQSHYDEKRHNNLGKMLDQVQIPLHLIEQVGHKSSSIDPHDSMIQEKRLSNTYFKPPSATYEQIYPQMQNQRIYPQQQQQKHDIPIIGKIIEQVPINIIEQAPKTEIIEIEKPIYIEKQVMVENKEVVDQYRHKVSKLEIDVLKLQQERQELLNQMEIIKNRPPEITYVEDSSKLREMEEKVNKLVTEIKQLTQVLEQKSDESEYWKKETEQLKMKCIEMENSLHKFSTEHSQKDLENNNLHEKVKRGAHAHKVLADQHNQKDQNITQLESALHEQEAKIIQLSTEVQRLHSNSQSKEEVYKKQVEELSTTIIDWQNKHKNIEVHAVQVREENSRAQNQMEILVNNKESCDKDQKRLQDLLQLQTKDTKDWKDKCGDLQMVAMKVSEYENKLALLTQELQRFQLVLKNKSEESEKYHSLLMQSELRLKDYENLESDNKRLSEVIMASRSEIEGHKEKLSSVQVNYLQCEKETNEYKNKFAMLAQEIEHQRVVINARDEDIDSWKQRYVQLQQSYISAKEEISSNANLQNELTQLKTYCKQMQDSIEEHKNNHTNLQIEHREQFNKTTECERQINLLNTQLQYSEKKIQHTDAISNAFREEIEKWKERYGDQENKMKQLDGHCSQIQSEFQHLQSKLQQTECIAGSYKEEIDKWKERHHDSENNCIKLSGEKHEHQQQSQNHAANVEQQKICLQSQSQELQMLKTQLADCNMRIHNQEQELHEHNSLRKQYEQIQILYNQRTEELRDQHEKYIRLERSLVEYRQFETKVHQLSEELNKLKAMIDAKDAELFDLRNKHSELKVAHDKLEGNEDKLNMYAGQIEHLMESNKQKDEDLDIWRYKWYEHSGAQTKVQDLLQVCVLCFAEIEQLRYRVNQQNETRSSQFLFRNQSNFFKKPDGISDCQSSKRQSDLNFKQLADLNIKNVTSPSPKKQNSFRTDNNPLLASLSGNQNNVYDILNKDKVFNTYSTQKNNYSDFNWDEYKKK